MSVCLWPINEAYQYLVHHSYHELNPHPGPVFVHTVVQAGTPVCVTVTLLDGIVLARSGFHHSANSRSVMALGTAVVVTDPEEKQTALDAIVDHVVPGRAADLQVQVHNLQMPVMRTCGSDGIYLCQSA